MNQIIDLTNKHINNWTVLGIDSYTPSGIPRWKCKCNCGVEEILLPRYLLSERSSSYTTKCKFCKENEYYSTGIGVKRNNLTVLDYINFNNKDLIYKCKCDCGNIIYLPVFDILNLHTKFINCEIGRSKNEINISNLLKNNNIYFEMQKSFKDCISSYGRVLYFDFFVNNYYIIEYDGEQHFHPTIYFKTAEDFKRQHTYDLLKNEYCFKNNIPIIRIPYDEEYTIEDLKLETTRFLLTLNNIEEYYKERELK